MGMTFFYIYVKQKNLKGDTNIYFKTIYHSTIFIFISASIIINFDNISFTIFLYLILLFFSISLSFFLNSFFVLIVYYVF